MRRLPYLNGIRAFESSARTGSFAGAAKELNVTPAAISRMVRLLEQRLGLSLFIREPNRLALTPAGRSYQSGLTQIFDALANLTDQIKTLSAGPVLTVGVGPTFAIRWLIPRLAAFAKIAPDVDVRITTGGAAAPFSDDWTCGIKLGTGDWPGLETEALFNADLTPVCAPQVARRIKEQGALAGEALLRVSHAGEDWSRWLAAAGLPKLTARGPIFEYYGQALQAAADGVGVALGIRPYIDDDLAAGRLVAPYALSVPKGERWYLVFREFRRAEPAFRAFSQWIRQAAQGAPKRAHEPLLVHSPP
jgi:LysR family glycine cleavage system transcriptional activator